MTGRRGPYAGQIHPHLRERGLAVPVDSLLPWPSNARRHADAEIRESLDLNGQYRAVLCQASTRRVIAGHGTWDAARALGWPELAAEFDPVDDEVAERILLVDNRTNDLAFQLGYVEQDLAALLQRQPSLEGTGYDEAALRDLLARIGAAEGPPDADAVPEPPSDPRTRPGDTWLLGRHRLACGDAFEAEARRRALGGGRPAMVLTDPPFAIYGSSSGVGSDVADDKMVRPFFAQLWRVLSAELPVFGHAYVHCDWRSYPALWEAARGSGMGARNLLVWDKGGFGLGSNYANNHELVAFFARMPARTTMTSSAAQGHRQVHRPNVLHFDRPRGDERQANAAKPVALLAELIGNSSDEGGLVLDLFGGSGSTAVAAESRGRAAALVEMEPRWCDVALRRWQALTGQRPVLEATGEEADFG